MDPGGRYAEAGKGNRGGEGGGIGAEGVEVAGEEVGEESVGREGVGRWVGGGGRVEEGGGVGRVEDRGCVVEGPSPSEK